jgi:hypothetical protein
VDENAVFTGFFALFFWKKPGFRPFLEKKDTKKMTIKKITLNKIREISYFSDKSATFFWDKNFHF